MEISLELQKEKHALLKELNEMSGIRQGSIYTLHRKCGKPGCECAGPGHPGHGPETIYSSDEGGLSKPLFLPSEESIALANKQIASYHTFVNWCIKWRDFSLKIADETLEQSILDNSNLAPLVAKTPEAPVEQVVSAQPEEPKEHGPQVYDQIINEIK